MQTAESFVLIHEEASPLRYYPAMGQFMELRSHSNSAHPENRIYKEGEDYIIDYEVGTIRRTAASRIRNGALHPLFGLQGFDHKQFPNYSNKDYTVYADYGTDCGDAEPITSKEIECSRTLPRLAAKLAAGEEALYVVYGDSISVGYEASHVNRSFAGLFADCLRSLFSKGRLRTDNQAIGGETSRGAAARVLTDVVPLGPDLVTIGYGMNDQNNHGHGNAIALLEYEANLRTMIEAIMQHTDSHIVLVTPCEPNPRWKNASGDMLWYVDTIRRLGDEYSIGVADAHSIWLEELAAGKTPESLLLNNINHPNDYGHSLYYKAFIRMLRE